MNRRNARIRFSYQVTVLQIGSFLIGGTYDHLNAGSIRTSSQLYVRDVELCSIIIQKDESWNGQKVRKGIILVFTVLIRFGGM
jgi:hypothetical protein